MQIEGQIVFEEIEGGIWGILAADGTKYWPVDGLPADKRRPGLAVRGVGEPADVISVSMWGRPVRLHSLEEISR